jgi:copper chaperone NosL
VLATVTVGCTGGPPPPAPLDTAHDNCRFCRMIVSDQRFAGQIVAAGEEPLFFDDLGCLHDYVQGASSLPVGAFAYVADHRTGRWVAGGRAVFTRVPGLSTPMNGGIVAHADRASRDSDAAGRGGTAVAASDVIGTTLAAGSR